MSVPPDIWPPETLRLAYSKYAGTMTVQLFDVRPRLLNRHVLVPTPLSTGVLVQSDKRDIILTAAHVLDSERVQRYGLFLGHPALGFVDLGDFSFVRTASNGNRVTDDDVDVAVLFIDQGTAARIREGGLFQFIPMLESESTDIFDAPGSYFIHGFPVSLTERADRGSHLTPTAISCFLTMKKESTGEWAATFGESTMDFLYYPELVASLDGAGQMITLPEPHGFSGCGVWKVKVQRDAIAEVSAVVQLAGIVHRFNRELQLIRATGTDVLRAIIRDSDPNFAIPPNS
jgi:hypothetical protein